MYWYVPLSLLLSQMIAARHSLDSGAGITTMPRKKN